jgi:hypothetical protein
MIAPNKFPYNIFSCCSICRVDCKFAINKKIYTSTLLNPQMGCARFAAVLYSYHDRAQTKILIQLEVIVGTYLHKCCSVGKTSVNTVAVKASNYLRTYTRCKNTQPCVKCSTETLRFLHYITLNTQSPCKLQNYVRLCKRCKNTKSCVDYSIETLKFLNCIPLNTQSPCKLLHYIRIYLYTHCKNTQSCIECSTETIKFLHYPVKYTVAM